MIPHLSLSERISTLVQDFLIELRRSKFSGKINHDYATRVVTSTDNSIYQVMPQAIISPKNIIDIQTVMSIADRKKFRQNIKITARGGGTGTNGQSLSDGIVLDCSRFMNRILEINIKQGWVRVEPGVVLDQLNKYLEQHSVFFAPDLSPSNRATLGGMVNTDACGKGSRIYGRTSNHVMELSCILSNGELLKSIPLDELALNEYKKKNGITGKIYKVVDEIVSRKADLIDRIFPKMNRFMTGYNLAKVYGNTENLFNLNYLLCGSEGTLAVLCEAKLRLTKLPKYKHLIVVKYESFDDALSDAEILVNFDPAAIETIDEKILKLARTDEIYKKIKSFIADETDNSGSTIRPTRTINLIEFTGNNKKKLEKRIFSLCKIVERNKNESGKATGFYKTIDPTEIKDLWNLRKKGVGLLGKAEGERKPIPFVEDTAVPVKNLAKYISEFKKILDSYDIEYAMYGHVDVGCLHVRPALDLKKPEEEVWIRELSDKVVRLVKKYDGVMWGEHGRGFRSEYTIDFFGEELHQDLQHIKEAFDPNNRLNPGKIVTPYSHKDSVVSLEGTLRGQKERQIDDDYFREYRSAMHCNGNAACLDYSPDSVMCPSSRITRENIHSPKGRASLIREWLRLLSLNQPKNLSVIKRKGLIQNFLSKFFNTLRKMKGEYDFSHEVYESMAGCLVCKACVTQCPVNVNVPEFRSKFMELYHSRYLRPVKDYLVGSTESLGQLFSQIPWLINPFLSLSFIRTFFKNRIGLRDFPLYSPESVRKRLLHYKQSVFKLDDLYTLSLEESKNSVILLQDAFTSFYESQVVVEFYQLLKKLNFSVYVAPFHPNGKPLHVKGFLKKFRNVAERNTKWLAHVGGAGIPIVGIDPSIVLTYRDEYLSVLEQNNPQIKVLLPQEFLIMNGDNCRNNSVKSEKNFEKYHLLGHCTEKTTAEGSLEQWKDVFALFGLDLMLINSGCCGMAGTYGHETEHYEESIGIYNLSWRKKIPEDPFYRKKILATGFSCRSQVKRIDGFRPLHPVQALLREINSVF
tara:strand:+ start:514 stop:3603 length:3090 start_codon:yes stop_codon:yes gene_type:complete